MSLRPFFAWDRGLRYCQRSDGSRRLSGVERQEQTVRTRPGSGPAGPTRLRTCRTDPLADLNANRHSASMKTAAAPASVVAVFLFAFTCSQATAMSGEERWTASSRTALAITGDIVLSPTWLRASGVEFPLRVAGDLPNFENDFDRPIPARVLAVTRLMNPRLRNGNTLGCGRGQPIRWIVVWRYDGGKALGMDTFSGSQMPQSVKDAGFCGSYFYLRE